MSGECFKEDSMKITSLVVILLVSMLFTTCKSQKGGTVVKDQFSGDEFLYYDKQDRIDIIKAMKTAIDQRYSLIHVKNKRIGVDTEKIFAEAIHAESMIEDVTESSKVLMQAKSNIDFLDRTKKLVASYQDTHFRARELVRLPVILNGLELMPIENEVYIVAIKPKVMKYNELISNGVDLYSKIKPGDRVISIDDVPILEKAKELAPFVSASNPDSIHEWAVEALSLRAFKYPEKNYSDWKIFSQELKREVTLRLPYYVVTRDNRKDAQIYLRDKNFQRMDDLKLQWNEQNQVWEYSREIESVGYDPTGAPVDMVGGVTWFDVENKTDPILRTGFIVNEGRSYGIMQILGFHVEKVTDAKGIVEKTFFEPLVEFINSLKQKKTPLIIDLRNNGGGFGSYPAVVLSHLAKTGATYPNNTAAFRVTRVFRQVLEFTDTSMLPNVDEIDGFDRGVDLIKEAVKAKREYTSSFAKGKGVVKPSDEVGGFDLPIVALVTPNCISACDGQSMIFKGSGRAKIIGTHSNGTGAGFLADGPFTTKWDDDYNVVTMNIPSYLFGFPGEINKIVYPEEDSYYTFNSENRPTEADVMYKPTLDDYLRNGSGWMSKAIEVLNAN